LAHVCTGVREDGHLGENLCALRDIGLALPIPEAHEVRPEKLVRVEAHDGDCGLGELSDPESLP